MSRGQFSTPALSRISFGPSTSVTVLSLYVELTASNQSFLTLDVTSGKVSIAADGNKQISFTSRPDIARYLAHVLTSLPPDQLKNRSFIIEGDRKVRANFRIQTLDNRRLCDLWPAF